MDLEKTSLSTDSEVSCNEVGYSSSIIHVELVVDET